MTVELHDDTRDARVNAIETEVGTGAIFKIHAGTQPTDCSDNDTGAQLVEMTLPSDWMAASSGGQAAKLGTWEDTSADATGTATYFHIWDSGETTCFLQGDVGQGSGTLQLDNTSIVQGQTVTITAFTITDGN